MRTLFKLCALCVICGCFAGSAAAQNTLVTGTFKTQEGKTPAQAGLSVKLCLLAGVLSGPTNGACTGGATALYGDATFTAHDMGAYPNQVRELTISGIPYYPGQVHVWIKGDGTIISLDGSAGVRLLPTIGASPSGLAYCAEISFTGSAANRLSPVELKGKNFCKNIPDQASVDWGTVAVAAITTPSVSYQLQTNASVSGYEEWGGIAAPANPAASLYRVFVNSSTNKLACITSTGADCNPASGGGGITSLNALTAATQTFAKVDDTNVTLGIGSGTSTHTFTLGWAGTLAKARQHAATVYTDQANTFGAFLQAFQAGANFELRDPTDTTKRAQFSLANILTSTTRTVTVPDANSVTVQPDAGAANNFLTAISTQGLVSKAQPAFSNLSGSATDAQIPDNITVTLAATATALAADPANCSAGQAAAGVTAAGVAEGCAAYVTSVSGTTEEIASTGGQTPVLSLPSIINLAGKTLKGASPLVFEGLTVDAFETTVVVTDPTAARNFTLPNADSVAVQPLTCGGTDKVSAVGALGVITCSADQGGTGADNISVNGTAAVDADFDDTTPAAPANAVNVKWQKDALTPNNLSAHLLFSNIATATFGANASFRWNFDNDGATDPYLDFTTGVVLLGGAFRLETPNELRASNAVALLVAGRAPDGASAIGVRLNANAALTVAGSKITTFENNTVVKSYIDKDGGFSGNAATASALAVDPTGCTNQFVRDIAAAGTLTCATVAKADAAATFVHTDQTNTYSTGTQDFEAATVTRPYRRLAFASFPGTCTANREFLERSDPATAGQVIYVCNAAGTGWDLVGDGGAGGGVPNPGANGMVACTGTACSTSAARTITGTTGNVTVTNGDGVAGNPTLDLGTTAVQTDQANTWSTGAQSFAAATSVLLPASAGAAPTADGDCRYDTTQKALVCGGNGAVPGFIPRVLKMTNCTTEANCTSASGGNQVDANAAAQGTTETNFASNWSMPASFLFTNKAIRVCAVLEATTSATAPTLLIRFKAGSTVLVNHVAGAPSNNMTNWGQSRCYILQGTAAAGASVNVEAGTDGFYARWSSVELNQIDQPVPAIATNGALTIQISAQWGTATTGNQVRLQQFYVMELN